MVQFTETHVASDSNSVEVSTAVRRALDHASHFLPSQGPIAVFVHHNTLHALEELSFSEAAERALAIYGAQPYLSESRYRQELENGRIRISDLEVVLRDDLGDSGDEPLGTGHTRFDLQLAMLKAPLRSGPSAELGWFVSETDALKNFLKGVPTATAAGILDATKRMVMRDYRDPAALEEERAGQILRTLLTEFGVARIETWQPADWQAFTLNFLWRLCQRGAHIAGQTGADQRSSLRARDHVVLAGGNDPDLLTHELLIRLSASYLDQGFASWSMPHRDEGFYRACMAFFESPSMFATGWLRRVQKRASEEFQLGLTPQQSIKRSLQDAGIDLQNVEAFIEQTLLALPGWAGMMWQMESNAAWSIRPAQPGTLEQFLAVRLLIDRAALEETAEPLIGKRSNLREYVATLSTMRPTGADDWVVQRAFLLFQVAQLLGWSPSKLAKFDSRQWQGITHEVEAFSSMSRRRVFQLAYEYRYRTSALDALSVRARRGWTAVERPKFQVMCCLDDREESFRRHLEEVEPAVESFGAAGFYSVAMYFRGIGDAHYIPLCPVVIKPRHYVAEATALTFQDADRRRAGTRRAIGRASHSVHVSSRGLVGGIVTALLGSLASIPMVGRVLFPHLTARVRRLFGGLVQPPPVTQLHLERQESEPGKEDGHLGFSIDEMVAIVDRLLHDAGLLRFSPLVVVFGHGSSSLNNPHESAYNCGACGGGRGGPNARALAQMANDPRVRARLRERGLDIPDATAFVGAYHNTCDDSVTYYDLEQLRPSQVAVFSPARDVIDEARQRNAHERARRFASAPLSLSPRDALHHVEGRAEDLAQARPEYNHATNAMCVVGRRGRTRGLFLDRRSFLTSYDPTIDDDQATILNRILQAVIPVCAGISLEYYFSCVDPVGYGCGSKLPHNITSLLGVMEGAASDLRTGLSAQMTEIHEPLRLLFVIESTPEAMLSIMERNPAIEVLIRNQWVQIAVLDPDSPKLQIYQRGRFHPYQPQQTDLPQVARSVDWYRGWRDHLGFAEIGSHSDDSL